MVSWRLPFGLFVGAVPIAWWAWTSLPATNPSKTRSVRTYVRELLSLGSSARMALVVLSFAVRFALVFGFLTYISLLAVREGGVSNVVAGALVSSWGAVALVASTQTGRATARWGHVTVMIWGFLIGGSSVVLMGLYPTPWTLFLSVPLLGLASGITAPTQKSLVNRMAPREIRAGAVSSAIIFQNVGRAAGPAMTGGLIAVAGVEGGFVLLGLSTGGVGCLMFAALRLLA
jgi:predicted MFS family arabinose efflux permease